MPNDQQHRELYDLLAVVAEGELSPDELARLETLTTNDSDARRVYRQTMYALAHLEHFGASGGEAEAVGHAVRDKQPAVGHAVRDKQPESSTVTSSTVTSSTVASARGACPTQRKSLLNWASRHPKGPAIAIAATLLIAALVVMGLVPVEQWMASKGKNDAEERQPVDTTSREFVAILNNAHEAKWLDGTQPRLSDPRLRVGRRLAITSGLIEVKYYSGVRVVIEGPAEFFVGRKDEGGRMKAEDTKGHPSSRATHKTTASRLDPRKLGGGSLLPHPSNAGYLALGKLVARVEDKEAQGFTIDTPSVRVEDLGTEFGVSVTDEQIVEFHVFSGAVKWARRDASGTLENSRKLVQGEAIRVDSETKRTVSLVAAADRFVQPGDISFLSRTEESIVRADGVASDLIAHYTFDETTGATAHNRAGRDDAGMLRTKGGDPFSFDNQASRGKLGVSHKVGSGALRFDPGDFVDIGTSLAMPTEITLSAWVKIDGFPSPDGSGHRHYVIGRMGPKRNRGTQFYVVADGSLSLIQYVSDRIKETATTAGVVTSGHWHHIAATRSASQQKLYVDGVLRATTRHAGPFDESSIGAQIGTGFSTPGGPFANGVMDDIRVYHRELGDTEIAALFSQSQSQGGTP